MAKIYSYTIILLTLVAIMNIAGIGYTSDLLTSFDFNNPSGWSTSPFIIALMGVIAATVTVGIAASLFGKSIAESYILSVGGLFAAGSVLFLVLIEAGHIVMFMRDTGMVWLSNILAVIFIAIVGGYTIALVQFWRGNDI